MSRGPGRIQRFILAQVEEHPDALLPVPVLAARYLDALAVEHWTDDGYESPGNTPRLRASFRRAARGLFEQERVGLWTALLPAYLVWDERWYGSRREAAAEEDRELWGPLRRVLCVGPPGLTPGREHLREARLAMTREYTADDRSWRLH